MYTKNTLLHKNMNSNKLDISGSITPQDKGEKKLDKTKLDEVYEITYNNYISKKIVLKKFKLDKIKDTIRKYKLVRTGTKPVLIERLTEYFNKITAAIKIQSNFRRWLVCYSIKYRGPALHDRMLCMNDTDFSTLEPLDEIPFHLFISVYDSKNILYGYNISSLIMMFEKSKKFENPYTREEFSVECIRIMKNIYNINFILFDFFKNKNSPLLKYSYKSNKRENNTNNENNEHIIVTNEQNQQYLHLIELRELTQEQRIREIFIEFDRLGNYTNSSWLQNLDSHRCLLLYRNLFAIWNHRAGLSELVKKRICQFFNPFTDVIDSIMDDQFDIDKMKDVCITVIENIIFCGINDEYRTLGAFHVLSGFTLVSPEARHALPWLYESITA